MISNTGECEMQLFKYASLLVTTFLLSISSVSAQDLYRTIDVIPLSENCDWAVAPDSTGVVFSTTDGGVADYLVGITTDAGFSSAVVSASANDLLVEQDDGSGLGFAMPRVLQGDNEVAYVMEITIDPFGDLLSGNPLSGNESGSWLDDNASWFNGTFGNGWSQASFGANNDEGGYWWGVGQVYLGYWDAGVGAVKGTYYVCRHPIQTGQGVITSIAHPIQTYNAITEDLSEKSGTLRGQGSIVGDVLIGVATAGTAGIAAKTGTVAKVVRKLKRTPDVPGTNVPGGVAPKTGAGAAHSASQLEKLKLGYLADEIKAATRVGSGLKSDTFHRAASHLSREQLQAGKLFRIRGGDGVERQLLQTFGELNGKKGIFEFIIDANGTITHQRFKLGSVLNGVPN